jgi:isoleucyl-tRNA synthetase
MKKYNEYKSLNLSQIGKDVLSFWKENKIFEQSVSNREGKTPYVFYEGPPSANGLPGIHHVMGRAIKDIFCRYQTLKGKQVKRKAGWDTHGLPIELGVEKTLGITKEDIGKKISIHEYNEACRKDVMKYTDIWNDLTEKIGYWVDMESPYITYENTYIESVWYLLKEIYKKGLLYKGYTIQPYSPAAGTGLSTHELNQPGCYKMVKDTTVVAQFKINAEGVAKLILQEPEVFFMAWTTTPWTLPSNTALAVGKNINYAVVKTFNQYTFKPIIVVLAKDLLGKHFPPALSELKLADYKEGDKNIPYEVLKEFKGAELAGIRYEQLMPYVQPTDGDAFKVIVGDFVTTEDGTGIVHIAPSFGADDFRVAKQNGIGSLTLVDKQGKFVSEVKEYAGEYVKEAYENPTKLTPEYKSIDVRIAIKLKEENKAFKVEKYEHTYPHCWRTDKPILYYPLDSWFIKTTALKDRMAALNKTINWKPESTGTGRFGNWLENLVDWNLSRSRYWGVPLPVWRTEDQQEELVIGSVEELKSEIQKAVDAGIVSANFLENFKPGDFSKANYNSFDLHRPYADDIILVSPSGKKMFRETDLIDVWFDSGAMPYAQLHYPFENKELIDEKKYYPADFIAEGVDQTRGWFFTLHAISTILFDSVAYKNVVSNGLVLDKNGNKMSKRLGNAVDPFETLEKYGADATRWYMITNAQPWDNLKFDIEGIGEVQRKFFGTLFNTYSFFSLYANIDGFTYIEADIELTQRPEIDQWILSLLNSLILEVDQSFSEYEPTRAGRAIQTFVDEHLSNWYVRLCRRRFWKGDYTEDKIAAYQTLYTCLEVISQLSAAIAPFFADKLFMDLNAVTGKQKAASVHLSDFPVANLASINKELEERMDLAQKISSMVLSLRKKVNIRVRQPLNKIMLPVPDASFHKKIEAVKSLILSEVNVKEIEYITDTKGILVKKIKANFKELGKKVGGLMKAVNAAVGTFTQEDIASMEKTGGCTLQVEGQTIELSLSDVEILSEDIPGWLVINNGPLTVALDVNISKELMEEGLAREIVNRIQNIRKDKGYEVTDKIVLEIQKNESINAAIANNLDYICAEILASNLDMVDTVEGTETITLEVDEHIKTYIKINKN